MKISGLTIAGLGIGVSLGQGNYLAAGAFFMAAAVIWAKF